MPVKFYMIIKFSLQSNEKRRKTNENGNNKKAKFMRAWKWRQFLRVKLFESWFPSHSGVIKFAFSASFPSESEWCHGVVLLPESDIRLQEVAYVVRESLGVMRSLLKYFNQHVDFLRSDFTYWRPHVFHFKFETRLKKCIKLQFHLSRKSTTEQTMKRKSLTSPCVLSFHLAIGWTQRKFEF